MKQIIKDNTLHLEEVYNPIVLTTNDKENLSICMRDSGFEFTYQDKWYSAKGGNVKEMKTTIPDFKTAEEILQPYVEIPFRHTKIVDKDNALKAMELFAEQFNQPKDAWIDMDVEQPEDYKRVIYFDSRDKGSIEIGYFVWSQTQVDFVTHWMPLPSLPNQ